MGVGRSLIHREFGKDELNSDLKASELKSLVIELRRWVLSLLLLGHDKLERACLCSYHSTGNVMQI